MCRVDKSVKINKCAYVIIRHYRVHYKESLDFPNRIICTLVRCLRDLSVFPKSLYPLIITGSLWDFYRFFKAYI